MHTTLQIRQLIVNAVKCKAGSGHNFKPLSVTHPHPAFKEIGSPPDLIVPHSLVMVLSTAWKANKVRSYLPFNQKRNQHGAKAVNVILLNVLMDGVPPDS
jgi:hypothetical protein